MPVALPGGGTTVPVEPMSKSERRAKLLSTALEGVANVVPMGQPSVPTGPAEPAKPNPNRQQPKGGKKNAGSRKNKNKKRR